MEQRRELDQQANLALTNHMITSRDRVEAIPTVAAPAPMVVTGQLAGAPGNGIGQSAGGVPTAAGFGAPAATAPAATMAAGWTGVPATPPASPGPRIGDVPSPPGASPVSTGLASTTDGVTYRPRSSAFQPTGTGASPGGAAFGPSSGGRAEAGGAAARGRAGFGVRPGAGAGRDGIPSRSAPGREGGPATPGPRGAGISGAGISGAGVSGARVSGGSRADTGSFLQPPVDGRSTGDDDTEHRDRYAQQADHIVGELPLVAPAVIGEIPSEEHRSRGRR
jgi:hypothetical protein